MTLLHAHVFSLPPIDWHDGTIALDKARASVGSRQARALTALTLAFQQAALEHTGWHGDVREGPFLIVAQTVRLDTAHCCTRASLRLLGLYWKQHQGGYVYGVSLIDPVTSGTAEVTPVDLDLDLDPQDLELPLSLIEQAEVSRAPENEEPAEPAEPEPGQLSPDVN